MRAYLTRDDELVVRDARPADAIGLWRMLQQIYVGRRGVDPDGPADDPVPATTYLDAIEIVNAFEGVANAIRRSAVRGFDEWRHGYVRTFELCARAADRRRVFPANDVLWLRLTRPLAEQLAASDARPAAWLISV